jgi:methionyl-tRNA synthetase
VRFQKPPRRTSAWYVCADDTHGTRDHDPRAEAEGITPERS